MKADNQIMKIFKEKLGYALRYAMILMMLMAPLSSEAQNPEEMTTLEALKLAIRGKVIQETYGNWFGPDWWGGTRATPKPGNKPPSDSMDEIAMAHDFGYQIAEEQGAKYWGFEDARLKSMADAIAAAQARSLTTWAHPPVKPKLAAKNRVIMYKTFEYLAPRRAEIYSTQYNYLKFNNLINFEEYERNRYTDVDFLNEVQKRINNWYVTYDIKHVLPIVYDPKTPEVGNLPDDKSLQQEIIDIAVNDNDKNDYLKQRQFGATQIEADSIIGWLKHRYVQTEKNKAIKLIKKIKRRNDRYMHYHVDVHIEGKSKVLSDRWLPLKAVVKSKIDTVEYLSYQWSKNIDSDESSVFFREDTSGKYSVSVSILNLGVEVATSDTFDIIVVDNSNPQIELQITGPSQVEVGDDIILGVSKMAKNEAGELLLQDAGVFVEWESNDFIFDRGDYTKLGFSETNLHIIKAYLKYKDSSGKVITISDTTKAINVVKKEVSNDSDIVDASSNENVKEAGESGEYETKDEDPESTTKPEETAKSDITTDAPSSSNLPLRFSGSAPSIWEGGNTEE